MIQPIVRKCLNLVLVLFVVALVAENLVLSRGKVPAIIDWKKEHEDLRAFMRMTPFFIPVRAKVSSLAAGQKQKLEICKPYCRNAALRR